MIRLTEQDVAEFHALYCKETGKDLTNEQAREYAERAVRLVAFVVGAGPLPLPP